MLNIEITFVHWLVILSAFISVAGAVVYLRDTISGKTKPNCISWSMWALAPLIGASAALAAGADFWSTTRILLAGLLPLIVFITSFFSPKSYWKLTIFDLICGAFSLLALFIWVSIDSPRIAILLAAIGDGFASLPTIIKAWKFPETETGVAYIAGFVSVLLVIPSIPVWNIENASFQVYLMIVNFILIFAVYRKRWSPR